MRGGSGGQEGGASNQKGRQKHEGEGREETERKLRFESLPLREP